MKFVNKIILILGILGAAAAAEGLNRFGSLVSALDGADAPIYLAMLVVSVVGGGILLLGLFNKSHIVIKWVIFVVLVGCVGLMFAAPDFPVSWQIIIGLIISAAAVIFIRTKKIPK